VRVRGGLNKIGVLALALLLAMGALGTAYGAWVDEIDIEGHFSTSGVNTTLECGACSLTGNPTGDITCSPTSDLLEVTITVTNAQTLTDYYCPFTVDNTASGTLPVKIVSVDLSGTYSGVSASIENPIPAYTVLDAGDTTTTGSRVHISLTSDEQVGLPLTFTLTADVLRWNE
jgi:hypothetical protein